MDRNQQLRYNMSWKTVNLNSDLYSSNYFLSEYVCRLCWCQNGVKEITSKISEDDSNITASQIIYECIGVDLTINTRPTKICSNCWNEVINFREFRSFCHTSQSKLARILRYGSQKPAPFEESNLNETEYSDLELDEINALFQDLINEPDGEVEPEPKPQPPNKVKKKISETFCFQCQTDLGSEEYLIQHNAEKHNIKSSFKCFRCDQTFRIKTLCVRHEIECWKASKKGYKCSICGKFLQDKKSFDNHLKAHENLTAALFKCKKCKEMFMTKGLLIEHMAIHKNRKWICDTCGHVFLKRFNLVNHKLMHEGVKQHVCPHCDYKTTYKNSLVIHIRKHTGERPYACSMCPQRCVNKSNLRKHMRLHLGIKRFHCNICDKKFSYKVSLDEHISRIHEQRTKQHCCEECGATYSWSQDLRRHVVTKHGDQPVKKRNSRSSAIETGRVQEKRVEYRSLATIGTESDTNEGKAVEFEIPSLKYS